MYKIRKEKNKSKKCLVAVLAGLLAGAALMSGCGSSGSSVVSTLTGSGSTVFKVGSEKCPEKEAKVILLNYQKDYASLYGVDLWSHEYEDGNSLEDYIKDLAVSQLAEVYTLDIIAGKQEITLTEDETAEAKAAAQEYIQGLSDAEQEYLGVGENDVQSLYERYALARKTYTELTGSISTEVSDDEARVMTLQKITVSDETTAKNIVAQLASGTDFATVSASYTDNTETINVDRSIYDEATTETLFALDTGAYSEAVSLDGAYCVFYCVSAFDADLTEQNKDKVLSQRMEDAVNEIYATYTEQLSSELNEDVWDAVSVDTSLELAGASFMEVYDAHFVDL